MKLISIIITAFLFSFISAFSQTARNCVATKVDMQNYKKMLQWENLNVKKSPTTPIVIRVFFRICEPAGGSLIDITEDQINQDFKHLVGAYQGHNICFINAGYDKLYNSAIDTFNTNNDDYHIFLPYGIQNCITVFYVDKLGGTNNSNGGGFSGVTYGVGTAWTIVAKAYIGKGTLEHEVGHCFGLLHTFDFRNSQVIENINGSNGTTAADYVADTYADPFAFAYEVPNSTCFHSTCADNFCTYDGTCHDLNNQTNYSPPYYNLMSYWITGFYPTYTLTAGQFTRINTFLTNNSALLATQSPATVTDGPYTISSGYHMASAVSTLTTSGTVLISGTANALLGAGTTVFLEPGFHAVPSSSGKIFIRHSYCDTTSNAYSIAKNTSLKQTTKTENTSTGEVKIFPNPATSSATVTFSLKQSAKNVILQVYNFNGQQMQQITIGNLMPATYSRTINLNNLPQGIYVVLLKYNNQFFKSTLVKGK